MGLRAAKAMSAHLDWLDWVLLVVYVSVSLGVGLWAARKPQNNSDDYFLAGRAANPLTVAISLISGLTSGISFIGSPGYAYEHGLGIVFQGVAPPRGCPI